jgi:YD repeat-containing protein
VRATLAGVGVTFETSDYREMKRRHASGVVYKLIYHANGNLCGDWDPDREVLLSTR